MRRHQRVAAYAVCRRDDTVLLARWTGPRGPEWTLPGGGIDHGEDPADAAVREVREETGYTARLDRLLAIYSFQTVIRDAAEPIDHHGIQIVYAGTVVDGELVFEVGGSTDMAAWVPLGEVAGLARVGLVDVGLAAAGLT
ncbi:MAG: 8-oxo-dGTP diphosphatase [Pseudonocardiales bacterium]|nr:8-oxo-dGTP diphosphatase [Pseudonocardiales bacterium]